MARPRVVFVVMIETKVHQVVELRISAVMVQVRDLLTTLQISVSVKREADTASSSRENEDGRFSLTRDRFSLGQHLAIVAVAGSAWLRRIEWPKFLRRTLVQIALVRRADERGRSVVHGN